MASSEELLTEQKREKVRDTVKDENGSAQVKSLVPDISHASEALKPTTTELVWSYGNVGKSLETNEVQFVISTLIYFDLIASIIMLLMDDKYITVHPEIEETVYQGESILTRLISSFQSFALFCFVLEIGALFYAFRFSVLSHCGYCLDIIIVFFIIYDDVYDIHNFPPRLLGLLRIWRVARLVTTSLDQAQVSHDETKANLRNMKGKMEKLRAESEQLEESSRAEIDLRKQVEKMLQGFKDEVDTLKEALQIAALDVAGTAEEEFNERRKEESETKYMDEEGDEYYDGANEETQSNRKVVVHVDGTFELD